MMRRLFNTSRGSEDTAADTATDLREAVADVQADAKEHRMEIAEAVMSTFRDLNSAVLVLSQAELQSHTTQLAMAPQWLRATYDPSKTFTWAFAGFNVLVSSFAPGGNRSRETMAHTTCCPLT